TIPLPPNYGAGSTNQAGKWSSKIVLTFNRKNAHNLLPNHNPLGTATSTLQHSNTSTQCTATSTFRTSFVMRGQDTIRRGRYDRWLISAQWYPRITYFV